ncbi:Aldose-1-epimerase domain containing protein [Dorcoceras hygrometricum]|uniref:Aldose-1-epimerase domain containing protein n=1 Tax=Dorcoceras hygrometricum TaxID=472368 RepID=A0A2Z7B9Y1_9LAMI|nr:Aldose-1-epimerase domain containing protein [Dorcoceras hygrometricum]
MRLRPPELETMYLRCEVPCFIGRERCDVLSMKIDSDLVIYRTTLVRTFQVVTICRVDKSEVLVVLISPHDSRLTLAMSLFDLQDVCIAIGSLATLDLPMVVDLIGIYGLKGPYYTLTTTNWFLQALSVISRGSWRDVARRFTMIRWANHNIQFWKLIRSVRSDRRLELYRSRSDGYRHLDTGPLGRSKFITSLIKGDLGLNYEITQSHNLTLDLKLSATPLLSQSHRRRPPPSPPPPPLTGICSGQLFEEFPSVLISSGLLVQADERTLLPIVDLIRRNLPPPTVKSQSPCDSGWSQAPVASERPCSSKLHGDRPCLARPCGQRAALCCARFDGGGGRRAATSPAALRRLISSSVLPRWHLCLAPTDVSRTRLFSVDCGSFCQSGPRPDLSISVQRSSSVDCVEWLNILQQIVQQLFAQLLSFLCHNTSRNSCFFVDWILCAWLPRFATSAFLASGYHVDWICNSTEARDLIHCSSRLVHHLATGCISTAALQLLYRSSSILRLFLAPVPAGPFAPADLSSSAEHDVVTDYIIIDGPLRCSSWFSFDVPADPSSSSSACSWFLLYQLIHYAPAGSTWPLPDFEHMT